VQERVEHRARGGAARGVHRHARRLVEHEEVAVLVQDREGQRLGREGGRRRRRELELDALAPAQARRAAGGAPVDPDVPRLDEPLRPGPAQPGLEERQGGVEPGPGQRAGDLERAPCRRGGGRGYQMRDRTRAFDFRITSTTARSK
jgi:hypothetical protein